MAPSIIIRVKDMAACAAFYTKLGIPLKASGGMRPEAWRASMTIDIVILPRTDGDGAPHAIRLGVGNLTRTACDALEGGGDVIANASGTAAGATIFDPEGNPIPIEVQHPPAPKRPISDVALFCHVSIWVDPNRDAIIAAVAAARGSAPRILGPGSLGGRAGDAFTLIVDGDDTTDLAAIDAALQRMRTTSIKLVARLASTLPTDERAILEEIAFTI